MLKSINQAENIYVLPQSQLTQGEGNSNSQISYKGNPNFEGNTGYDRFQKANNPNSGSGTNTIGIIGLIAGTIISFAILHKSPKAFKEKATTFLKKANGGVKDVLTRIEDFIFKRTSVAPEKVTSKASETMNKTGQKVREALSESTSSTISHEPYGEYTHRRVRRPKSFRRTVKKPEKPLQKTEQELTAELKEGVSRDYRRANKDIYRQIEEERVTARDIKEFNETLAERPTKRQRIAIKKNNAKAQEESAKGRQIGENVSKEVIEKLKKAVSPAAKSTAKATKPIANAAKPIASAAPIKRGPASRGPVRINSKMSKTSMKPKKATQKPLRRNDLQTKILEQLNPKAASEIKGLEGNIKRLQQRIKGAELMQKDTKSLKKELENNQKKLTQLKSEALKAVPNAKPTSKKVPKVETNPMAQTSDKNVRYMTEQAKVNIPMIHNNASEKAKPVKSVHDLIGVPFNKIPGERDASGTIRQYTEQGTLKRIIKDKGNGLVEIKEVSSNNPNGATYLLRDGIMLKKSKIGKQSEYMRRLVNSLNDVSEPSEVKRIIDSYADKCGMKKVNETIMLEGKETKVIYKGFNYDITADGRVLAKSYGATGKACHSDVTQQLSKKTKRVKMYPNKHLEGTNHPHLYIEPRRLRA